MPKLGNQKILKINVLYNIITITKVKTTILASLIKSLSVEVKCSYSIIIDIILPQHPDFRGSQIFQHLSVSRHNI